MRALAGRDDNPALELLAGAQPPSRPCARLRDLPAAQPQQTGYAAARPARGRPAARHGLRRLTITHGAEIRPLLAADHPHPGVIAARPPGTGFECYQAALRAVPAARSVTDSNNALAGSFPGRPSALPVWRGGCVPLVHSDELSRQPGAGRAADADRQMFGDSRFGYRSGQGATVWQPYSSGATSRTVSVNCQRWPARSSTVHSRSP
jgi:hypothetical protein